MNAFTNRLATPAWALTVLAALASAAACSTMPDVSTDVVAGLRPADTQAVFLEARVIGVQLYECFGAQGSVY